MFLQCVKNALPPSQFGNLCINISNLEGGFSVFFIYLFFFTQVSLFVFVCFLQHWKQNYKALQYRPCSSEKQPLSIPLDPSGCFASCLLPSCCFSVCHTIAIVNFQSVVCLYFDHIQLAECQFQMFSKCLSVDSTSEILQVG